VVQVIQVDECEVLKICLVEHEEVVHEVLVEDDLSLIWKIYFDDDLLEEKLIQNKNQKKKKNQRH